MHDAMSLTQAGYLDYGFLGAAQIDCHGNINTTIIGDWSLPKVRFPGSGGANDVGSSCWRTIIVMRQDRRRFVERLEDAPPGAVIVLQSHGSPRAVYEELERRGLEFIDATCPMVEVIHKRVREVERQGYVPVIIGQTGHEEVRGIAGQVDRAIIVRTPDEVTPELLRDVSRAGVVVQSTSVREDALQVLERIRALVPDVVFYDTICQPTKSRQREVEENSRPADTVIIIGSKRSANTLHLYRIAQKNTPCTYLVDRAEGVDAIEIPADPTVFVASGASNPEELIFEVVRRLESRGGGAKKKRAAGKGKSKPKKDRPKKGHPR